MSVTGTKPPSERSLVAVVDREQKRTVREAQQAVAPVVATETPRRSGKTAAALAPRVSQTTTGGAVSVRAARGRQHSQGVTVAQVVRWVNRGTGLYRTTGPKRKIRSSRRFGRMTLPGGRKVFSVKGQHPNAFMDRIYRRADPQVTRVFEHGATRVAGELQRAFTGGP